VVEFRLVEFPSMTACRFDPVAVASCGELPVSGCNSWADVSVPLRGVWVHAIERLEINRVDAEIPGQAAGSARTRPVVADVTTDPAVPIIREQTPVADHVVVAQAPAPVVQERIVVQQIPVVQSPLEGSRTRTVATRRIDVAAALAVITGIVLGIIGAVAIARAGLDGPLGEPVVEVAGFSHTALLGIIEVAVAVILVAVGLGRDRGALLFTSILFGAAAVVAAIEPTVGGDALAIDTAWAVSLAVVFAAIAGAAALVPAVRRTTERVGPI
jgi:hypothetical protein